MSAATTDVVIEAAHFDPVTMFRTGTPAQAASRGRQALRARRRPDDLRGRGADRVAELLVEHGGGTVAGGVTVVGDRPRPRPRSRSPPTCRPRSPAWTIDARDRRRRTCAPSAARSAPTATSLTATVPPLAARPHRPLRPGRGGRPDRRLRQGALGAARRSGRARADHASSGCAAGSAARSPAPGFVRGDQLPVRRRPRPRRGSASPATTTARTAMRLANPLSRRGAAADHDPAAGPARGARPQRRARRSTDVALFETAHRARCRAGSAAGAPILRRRPRPTEDESSDLRGGAAGPAAAPRRRCWPASGSGGWWGAGRAAGWADADRGGAVTSPLPSASSVDGRAAERAPWHPGRCAEMLRRRGRRRPCRRAAPEGLRGVRPARAHRGGRGRPRRAAGRAARSCRGPELLDLPGGQGGRRAGRRRVVPAADVAATLREGAGELLRVGAAVRRLHRRPGRRRARSRWPSRCASGRPTAR